MASDDEQPDPDATTAKAAPKKPAVKKTGAKKPARKKAAAKNGAAEDAAPKQPVFDEPVTAASAVVDETRDDLSPDAPSPAPDGEAPAAPGRVDRLKAAAAVAAAKAEVARDRLEASRDRSRTIDAVFGVAEHDEAVGGGVLAGAVAFRVFLFLIPFVFVLVTLIALVADILGQGQRSFANATGVAGIAANAIKASGDQSIFTRLLSLGVGVFAVYLGAKALLKVLRIVHALVWRVPATKLDHPLRSVAQFVGVVTGLFAAGIVISSFRGDSLLAFLVGTAMYVAVPATIWLVASMRAFPHPEGVGWRQLVPGALTVGIGFQVLQIVTVVWITHLVESKSSTYGAIGVALALLFWAYVLGRIVCGGAVLNAALWWRDHDDVASAPPGPVAGP